ncbi:MAG: FAD-dependent oxidoreductase, partial [Pseudomonadota bacterium]
LDANRLTFECVTDACRHGAVVVNHVEAVALLRQDGAVTGVSAKCALEGQELQIRARVTVNAAGPWAEALLRGANVDAGGQPLAWTRNLNVVMRQLLPHAAIGVSSRRASDSAVGNSRRLFFVTPWRDCSIVGTSHEPFNGDPDAVDISETELQDFVDELAEAMPGMGVRREDVHYVHSGLTPADLDEGGDPSRRAHRPALRDHRAQGVQGFITAIGIKYTTAPVVAEHVTAMLSAVLGSSGKPSAAPRPSREDAGTPQLPGGLPAGDAEVAWATQIYGSRASAVLSALTPGGTEVPRHVFRCRILHGIRHEMALRLTDGLFRCTDLVERGRLTADELEWCADAFQSELGWSGERRSQELALTKDQFARRHVRLRAA